MNQLDLDDVTVGDASFPDQLTCDAPKRATEACYRPVKVGDASSDFVLEELVVKDGAQWVVFCKRQAGDGENGVSWVIQMWTYGQSGVVNVDQWVLRDDPWSEM